MMDQRAELAERQRQWMVQRQAELDRKKAEQSLGISGGSGGSAPPEEGGGVAATAAAAANGGVGSAEVLDRLAEQIASRLQVEVRKENARIMQDGAVGARVESLLERHIASNNCPVCFELMAGKVHEPTLLFPCGHTFCATCLRTHLDKLGRKTCPYCREQVQSQAPNVALRQVIDGFVERQQALVRGEVLPEIVQGQENVASAQQQQQQQQQQQMPMITMQSAELQGWCGGEAPSEASTEAAEASKYAEQYRMYSMRCRVMHNQLAEARAESEGLRTQLHTAQAVLGHLSSEKVAAQQRLEAARVELEVVQAQCAEQASKCEAVVVRQHDIEQMEQLLGQTHASLEADRRKALLLVRNFHPALADRLEREIEE